LRRQPSSWRHPPTRVVPPTPGIDTVTLRRGSCHVEGRSLGLQDTTTCVLIACQNLMRTHHDCLQDSVDTTCGSVQARAESGRCQEQYIQCHIAMTYCARARAVLPAKPGSQGIASILHLTAAQRSLHKVCAGLSRLDYRHTVSCWARTPGAVSGSRVKSISTSRCTRQAVTNRASMLRCAQNPRHDPSCFTTTK